MASGYRGMTADPRWFTPEREHRGALWLAERAIWGCALLCVAVFIGITLAAIIVEIVR
jgi:hypothetical protein